MRSTEHSNNDLATTAPALQPVVPRQADTDAQLLDLWLHGRSRHTQRAYPMHVSRLGLRPPDDSNG